jgi:hypothetical protein
LVAACGDDSAPTDAGPEAVDAGRDAGVDAGPSCDPACGGDAECCDVSGEPMCVDTETDPNHCGSCDLDCVATFRGFTCARGGCVCGRDLTGCGGGRSDRCCPPRRPGEMAYCESIDRSSFDCGACGRECDPLASDRCVAGECVCGALNHHCDGTRESRCCPDMIDEEIRCADLGTDRDHCGECGNRCQVLERCSDGVCTLGETECDSCEAGEICCHGECCARSGCGESGCE